MFYKLSSNSLLSREDSKCFNRKRKSVALAVGGVGGVRGVCGVGGVGGVGGVDDVSGV